MTTAYLILKFQYPTKKGEQPTLLSAGIYSEDSTDLTRVGSRTMYAELYHVTGSSFAEARRSLIEEISRSKEFNWVFDWMEPEDAE